jgi:hypothetical protein
MERHAAKILFMMILVLGTAGLVSAEEPEPSSDLKFLVLKDDSGKPVRNASVVLHPVDNHGKQERGGFELKTDPDGKASFDGVPYGTLRVQVLAHGFQTFGQDYEISRPATDIVIRLKRPQGQYSIYENQQNEPKKEPEKKPK